MQPALTVVVPAYNAAEFIGEALDSILTQTFRNLEIIVINDGSTDDTQIIVERFVAQYDRGWPRVVLINQNNQGPSAARNTGLKSARAPIIGFLDADDRWAPEKAERHIELLNNHPEIDLSFSWFRFVGEKGEDLNQYFTPNADELDFIRLLTHNVIHTGTVVARRDAIEKAGCFDENLSAFEDWDLWLRIAQLRSSNLFCLKDILSDYRRRKGQITRNWRVMNDGWEKVFANHSQIDPQNSSRIVGLARGNQLEYCASLAYNAGDNKEARRLMAAAWRSAGHKFLRQPNTLLMTAISLATLLPRPLQLVLGHVYTAIRAARLRLAKPFTTKLPTAIPKAGSRRNAV